MLHSRIAIPLDNNQDRITRLRLFFQYVQHPTHHELIHDANPQTDSAESMFG